MDYILGLDFGGTKLAAGVVNPKNGIVMATAFAPTPKQKKASESLKAMLILAKQLMAKQKTATLRGIGVSFDGPVATDNKTARFSMHVSGWDNFALAEKMEQEFQVPSLIANDADAA